MHGKYLTVFLMLLVLSVTAFGQMDENVPAPHRFEIGASAFYFHPGLKDFNGAMTNLEGKFGLPYWKDMNVYYLVLPSIAYRYDSRNVIGLQAGGSVAVRQRDDSRSYYAIWMAGAEYRHQPFAGLTPFGQLWVSAGVGGVIADFRRSYGDGIAIDALGRKIYFDFGVEFRHELTNRLSVGVDLRYLFVPTMNFGDIQTSLALKSFAAGGGIYYTL